MSIPGQPDEWYCTARSVSPLRMCCRRCKGVLLICKRRFVLLDKHVKRRQLSQILLFACFHLHSGAVVAVLLRRVSPVATQSCSKLSATKRPASASMSSNEILVTSVIACTVLWLVAPALRHWWPFRNTRTTRLFPVFRGKESGNWKRDYSGHVLAGQWCKFPRWYCQPSLLDWWWYGGCQSCPDPSHQWWYWGTSVGYFSDLRRCGTLLVLFFENSLMEI